MAGTISNVGGGLVFTGKDGVGLYRLVAMKHAVGMEARGLKMSRGRSWTAVAKKEFGLSRCAKTAVVLTAIEMAIADMRARVTVVTE